MPASLQEFIAILADTGLLGRRQVTLKTQGLDAEALASLPPHTVLQNSAQHGTKSTCSNIKIKELLSPVAMHIEMCLFLEKRATIFLNVIMLNSEASRGEATLKLVLSNDQVCPLHS